MAEAGAHASHTTGDHATQAVDGKAGTKGCLQLVLEYSGDLIAAQVGHGCWWLRVCNRLDSTLAGHVVGHS